jgi:hypothetical protein
MRTFYAHRIFLVKIDSQMKILLAIPFLYPSIFTILAVFLVDQNTVPIILLVFLVYSGGISSEDLGRIEHKIDSIFKGSINDELLKRKYEKLHQTAWDHDYPMSVEEPLVTDGKLRNDVTALVSVLNKIIFFLLSAYWLFSVVKS